MWNFLKYGATVYMLAVGPKAKHLRFVNATPKNGWTYIRVYVEKLKKGPLLIQIFGNRPKC